MAFPDGFLWGAATSAHQVEGNNTNSDFWVLEHAPGTIFAEPSGDACDHYRRYQEDIALIRRLGLTSYRFSIEWARVEPEPGRYSAAAIAHYRDVLRACHDAGLTPMVTMMHFTSPRWLMKQGGWASASTPARFAAYCRVVLQELGPLIPYLCTINEANVAALIRQATEGGDGGADASPFKDFSAWMEACAVELGTPVENVNTFFFTYSDAAIDVVRRAHVAAREAVREVSPATLIGLSLAMQDYQAQPGGSERAEDLWAGGIGAYLSAVEGDDFLGVQSYTRVLVGPQGPLPHPDGAELTQMGFEFYPQALENVLRRAADIGLPLIVTENGVATADDGRRTAFIREAVEGVERCLADGLDVRGYYYWSALDNYEWMFGYAPTFGLIAVDRETQKRTVKDSADFFGAIARGNGFGPSRD